MRDVHETKCSLNFGSRAMKVQVTAHVNYEVSLVFSWKNLMKIVELPPFPSSLSPFPFPFLFLSFHASSSLAFFLYSFPHLLIYLHYFPNLFSPFIFLAPFFFFPHLSAFSQISLPPLSPYSILLLQSSSLPSHDMVFSFNFKLFTDRNQSS